MTARTRPPVAYALGSVGSGAETHWCRIDPATGRIDSVTSSGPAPMPDALRALLNLQPIPAEHAQAYYADPVDRSWIDGTLGRCAPQPLRLKTEARAKRHALLSACDYLLAGDAPIEAAKVAAWRVYRQALRDLTKQPEYPGTIVWPTPPPA